MVEECCKFVDQAPDDSTKLKLIDTLRAVTEGKVGTRICRREREREREEEGRSEIIVVPFWWLYHISLLHKIMYIVLYYYPNWGESYCVIT